VNDAPVKSWSIFDVIPDNKASSSPIAFIKESNI